MNNDIVFEQYRNEFSKVIKPYLLLRILREESQTYANLELHLSKLTGKKVTIDSSLMEKLQKEYQLLEAISEDSTLWDILPSHQVHYKYQLTEKGRWLLEKIETELMSVLLEVHRTK